MKRDSLPFLAPSLARGATLQPVLFPRLPPLGSRRPSVLMGDRCFAGLGDAVDCFVPQPLQTLQCLWHKRLFAREVGLNLLDAGPRSLEEFQCRIHLSPTSNACDLSRAFTNASLIRSLQTKDPGSSLVRLAEPRCEAPWTLRTRDLFGCWCLLTPHRGRRRARPTLLRARWWTGPLTIVAHTASDKLSSRTHSLIKEMLETKYVMCQHSENIPQRTPSVSLANGLPKRENDFLLRSLFTESSCAST